MQHAAYNALFYFKRQTIANCVLNFIRYISDLR